MEREFEAALSPERFARYLDWAGGNRVRGLDLYALNTRLSGALYTPLQMLEVAFRNRVHAVLSETRHDRWFDDAAFVVIEHQKKQLANAVEELARSKREGTPGRIVAALPFSFWTSMVAPDYETLWQTTLNRITCREDGKGLRRKELSSPLKPVRVLRNRIAHHEPILHWNLPKHYGNIVGITRWLSPAAAAWSERHSRFPEVFPADGIALHHDVSSG